MLKNFDLRLDEIKKSLDNLSFYFFQFNHNKNYINS